jgi:hypothetical protein
MKFEHLQDQRVFRVKTPGAGLIEHTGGIIKRYTVRGVEQPLDQGSNVADAVYLLGKHVPLPTYKQYTTLCFIMEFARLYGFQPSQEEICKGVGYKCTNSITQHVERAEEVGYCLRISQRALLIHKALMILVSNKTHQMENRQEAKLEKKGVSE